MKILFFLFLLFSISTKFLSEAETSGENNTRKIYEYFQAYFDLCI